MEELYRLQADLDDDGGTGVLPRPMQDVIRDIVAVLTVLMDTMEHHERLSREPGK